MPLPAELPALLLRWYDRSARTLPWREEPTPYRVWVSEIMLQQTRVEAVKPYYDRFLEALPDLPSLAACPPEKLMKLWEGLGYYNRAKNLQKAARQVMERYGGELPGDFASLRALPGVGDYTAGAVASIAFGIPVPAVDGNVLRVRARLLADEANILDPKTKKQAEAELRELIPRDRAGDFNQALMELGALVCLPGGAPRCGDCPLRELCLGLQNGAQERLPVKTKQKPRRTEARTVFLLRCADRLALRRRPETGLLSGLWELPGAPGRLTQAQVKALWPEAVSVKKLPAARHVFTHVEWRMSGWELTLPEQAEGFLWADRQQLLGELALPAAFKTYVNLFLENPAPKD